MLGLWSTVTTTSLLHPHIPKKGLRNKQFQLDPWRLEGLRERDTHDTVQGAGLIPVVPHSFSQSFHKYLLPKTDTSTLCSGATHTALPEVPSASVLCISSLAPLSEPMPEVYYGIHFTYGETEAWRSHWPPGANCQARPHTPLALCQKVWSVLPSTVPT